jgi:hypothetical protein
MSIENSTPPAGSTLLVRLHRSDLLRADDGTFLLPVTLRNGEKEMFGYARLDVDDAARLHAQLHRHLTDGWALTEAEKASRETGEIYQVGGSVHLP